MDISRISERLIDEAPDLRGDKLVTEPYQTSLLVISIASAIDSFITFPVGEALHPPDARHHLVLDKVWVRSRDGHTGERRRGDIGFQSLRGGSVVGDHTVILASEGERIELTHRASDRGIFARGAVKASPWGRGRGPGLFTMSDVLGLS